VKRSFVLSLVLFFPTIVFISGCNPSPPEKIIQETITAHFEENHYRVVEMSMGEISSIAMGQKRYMGTEGYVVPIRSITLEASRDKGEPVRVRKGDRLIFKNGMIHLREKAGERGTWIVVNISGIPVL
jgi:hypothetical protein